MQCAQGLSYPAKAGGRTLINKADKSLWIARKVTINGIKLVIFLSTIQLFYCAVFDNFLIFISTSY